MEANTLELAVALTKKFTSKPSNEELLKLYSLYKQATEGDNNEDRPGGFDFVAAAKYNSWLAIKGKSKSFQQLYEVYAESMFKICLRYLKNTEDAEDVLSVGFTKVFSQIGGLDYRDEKSFRAWLKKIMINECLMHLRKQHNFLMVTDEEAETIVFQDNQLSNLDSEYLYQEIAALPTGYRTVFNLYCVEGYKHLEIAEMLGIKEATSRSQLNKAKNILKERLILMQKKDERRRV
mgnify:CR=1 FL=1